MAEVAKLVAKLEADIAQFKKDMRTATGAVEDLKKGSGRLDSALKKVSKGATKAAKFGVAAVTGAAVASVKAFADFDDALNQSVAIMGDVSDAMRKDMSDAAKEVARTTRISAKDAAESYFFLASAGLDAEQSIAALPQVAAFAQAGMFDMARATDLATDAQSALGLTVDDAQANLANLTRVTDVLVKANTLANASVEQFSEALTNKAGAALKLLGKDMEEGVAVLAAFADQGVKGSEAGEKLNIVLRDLQTASLKNRGEFEKLGIEVFDAQGEFRNMADVIGDLEVALEDMSDEEKRATLMLLGFQDRSVSAIMTLIGLSDEIRGYESSLRDAGGTTEEVAEKQMESFAAQLENLKNKLQIAAIETGEKMLPAMKALVAAVEDLLPLLEGFGKGMAGVANDLAFWTGNATRADKTMRDFQTVFGRTPSSISDVETALRDLNFAGTAAGSVFSSLGLDWAAAKLTAEEFEDAARDLFGQMDLGKDDAQNLLDNFDELAEALGLGAEKTEILRDVIEDTASTTVEFTDEQKAAQDAFNNAQDAQEAYERGLSGGLNPTLEETEEETRKVETATERASRQMQTMHDKMRALTDPVFAALDATSRYRQAQDDLNAAIEKYGEDSREAVDAGLDVAQSYSDLIGAAREYAEVNNVDLKSAFETLAEKAGLPADTIAAILEDLNELDGLVVESEHIIRETTITRTAATSPTAQFFQHGGPIAAHAPAIVGERGPELFVPQTSGMIHERLPTSGGGAPMELHFHNEGVIGSQAELQQWVQEAIEETRRINAS